jgi:hypothetical protein
MVSHWETPVAVTMGVRGGVIQLVWSRFEWASTTSESSRSRAAYCFFTVTVDPRHRRWRRDLLFYPFRSTRCFWGWSSIYPILYPFRPPFSVFTSSALFFKLVCVIALNFSTWPGATVAFEDNLTKCQTLSNSLMAKILLWGCLILRMKPMVCLWVFKFICLDLRLLLKTDKVLVVTSCISLTAVFFLLVVISVCGFFMLHW